MKKDDIEDVYSELKSFTKEPPKELWDNIEARLHPKKKRRVAFWFWGSVAAVLVLMFGYVFYDSVKPNVIIPIKDSENQISNIKQPNIESNEVKSGVDKIKEDSVSEIGEDSLQIRNKEANEALQRKINEGQLASKDNSAKQINNQEKNKRNEKLLNEGLKGGSKVANITDDDNLNGEEGEKLNSKESILDLSIAHKRLLDETKITVIAEVDSLVAEKKEGKLDLYKELMAEKNHEKDSLLTKIVDNSKWSMEVLGGLSNTASDASLQGTSVNTEAINNFVYTFKVGYAISDKLLVKTGVGKNSLGQEINNIVYGTSDSSFSPSNGAQSIVSDQSFVFYASPDLITDFTSSVEYNENGRLQQQLDYIQVPLEIFYKLFSKKTYDISLGLGGNVNFITNNTAYLNNEEIGENIGVNNTVLGVTLNSNFSYNLTKKTILFFEPSYNYFQKPIDNRAQDFKNTQLRFLFGLRFQL